MTSTCACGNVEVTLTRSPDFIYDCNCSLCRKTGAAWGYFCSAEVHVAGETQAFTRRDTTDPKVDLHACPTCSATTHFVINETYKQAHPELDQIGVNMRLFDPEALKGVEVHYPDGKAWSGDGAFGFRRPKMKVSDAQPW